ncbi:MAG: Vps62-related protein [Planctomycetes bacterium]|nr:Vps62-related protein [Planctomycetota bacterium]
MKALLLRVSCAALLAAAAGAQTASFTTHGTACALGGSSRVVGSSTIRLSGTLPIVGSTYTVTTTGPARTSGVLMFSSMANFAGIDLSPIGMPGCRQYISSTHFTIPIVLDAQGVSRTTMSNPLSTPLGTTLYFQARILVPGANAAGALTSALGIARAGTEPDLSVAEIAQFAPIVRIHPAEEYRPMSPDEFIARSRFRHHRGWQSDQGFNRNTLSWVTTNSHDAAYYGIPTNVLEAYTLHANGQNRRPRDSNCGDSYNVFLQSPGRLTGPTAPTGVVPAYYHYRRVGSRHEIQYWWFCGFNDSFATFNHQGDWEHVTVRVENRAIVSVYFASHEGGSHVALNAGLRFVNGRPLVYMAKGSHASYPTTGTWMAGVDVTSDLGPQWDTSRLLRPLATQPWRNYAGAWGEVGSISTTTGPLGPWHKRNGQ